MRVNQPREYSASHSGALHLIVGQTSLSSDGNDSNIDTERVEEGTKRVHKFSN